jgi:hypothetical protein
MSVPDKACGLSGMADPGSYEFRGKNEGPIKEKGPVRGQPALS